MTPVEAGEPYRPDHLHLDHLIPWASGGPSTPGNLIVCCADCNLTRPRPTTIVRHPKVRVIHGTGYSYWWRDPQYRPPKVMPNDKGTWALATFKKELGIPPLDVLRRVVTGVLGGTVRGSIRAEIPAAVAEAREFTRWEDEMSARLRALPTFPRSHHRQDPAYQAEVAALGPYLARVRRRRAAR